MRTYHTIRANVEMLPTMVSDKTFPDVSCLLPRPQSFFISGDCHLKLTSMCITLTSLLKLISILCLNKYNKILTIASRKQNSHNLNSVLSDCRSQDDKSATDCQQGKSCIMPNHITGIFDTQLRYGHFQSLYLTTNIVPVTSFI